MLLKKLYRQFKPHNNWLVDYTRWQKFKYNCRRAIYTIRQSWYYTKCDFLARIKWPGYNFNTTRLKEIPNYYREYSDQILFFAFQIFENYYVAEDSHVREGEWWETAQELYAWWQKRKHWLEDTDEQDDEMFMKLAHIRGHLWI